MRIFYDFHLHSCLSPCGDRDMTPNNIVHMAQLAGLQAVALTDHNSCRNCPAFLEVARQAGVTALPGMELCTAEEIHVVCLFPTLEAAMAFDRRVFLSLPAVQNRPEVFGEQLILDAEDEVAGRVDTLLTTASAISIDEVAVLVREAGGAAFPAHIDRPSYSILSALGDIPRLGFHAMELTAGADTDAYLMRYPVLREAVLLWDSDAHDLERVQEGGPYLDLPDSDPLTILKALRGDGPCGFGRG